MARPFRGGLGCAGWERLLPGRESREAPSPASLLGIWFLTALLYLTSLLSAASCGACKRGFSCVFHRPCCLKILPLECDFPPPFLSFSYFFFFILLFAELLRAAAASEHVLPWWPRRSAAARRDNASPRLPARAWRSCNLYSNLAFIWHPRPRQVISLGRGLTRLAVNVSASSFGEMRAQICRSW